MYYIIHKQYHEFNQFEGEWILEVSKFRKLEDAKAAHRLYKKNQNIKEVSQILVSINNSK